MPGPDGIPYIAWRQSGQLAIRALWEAADALQSTSGENSLHELNDGSDPDGHDFNLGTLVCLGKKKIDLRPNPWRRLHGGQHASVVYLEHKQQDHCECSPIALGTGH